MKELRKPKREPISDEPGHWKHAPRPNFDQLTQWEIYGIIRDVWDFGISRDNFLCRQCSHSIRDHGHSYCLGCKHECAGAETLLAELRPIALAKRQALERHCKPWTGRT